MPRGGKREGAGRHSKRTDNPRDHIKHTRFNTKEWLKISRAMKGLKFSCSTFLRQAALTYAKDQSLLSLDPDDLRRIEDIRTAVGHTSKSEAVSAAVGWCVKRYWLELLTEMVKADLPGPKKGDDK